MKHFKQFLLIAAAVVASACDDYSGVVTNKKVVPAYSQVVPTMMGKVVILHKVHHPAQWQVRVDERHPFIVTQSEYNSLNIGDSVVYKWHKGRFSLVKKND